MKPRLPGEWERHRATWIFWPTGASKYLYGKASDYDFVKACFLRLIDILSAFEPVRVGADPATIDEARHLIGKRAEVFAIPLDDAWARDAAPTFAKDGERDLAFCWRCSGWGGKFAPISKDSEAARRVAEWEGIQTVEPNFSIEGGAILSDGKGGILTTAPVLSDAGRRSFDHVSSPAETLQGYLAANEVLVLPSGFDGDDTGGHVDVVAAISPDGLILLNNCSDPLDPNHKGTAENMRYLRECGKEIVSIRQPVVQRAGDHRLPYSYLNFYPANECIIIPQFGDPSDEYVVGALAEHFPDREPIPFDARPFYLGGGGVHCVTQPVFL